jgi:hypothetical protein
MAFWDVCGNVAAVWVRYPRAHGGSELHFTFQLYAARGRERGSRWLARLLARADLALAGFQRLGQSLGSHTPWQIIWQLARSTFGRQYSSCSGFVLDDFEETVSCCRLADIGSD